MGFEFNDRTIVEHHGKWCLDTLQTTWEGLDSLLDSLTNQYESYARSQGNTPILNLYSYKQLHDTAHALITNSKDSINIKRAQQKDDYLGKISIEVKVKDEKLQVSIEDNGAGIEEKIAPYLFTWLGQAPIPPDLLKKNMDNELGISGGMGDSLRQIKECMVKLGGNVFYKDKGINQGAVFGYEVPIGSVISLKTSEKK